MLKHVTILPFCLFCNAMSSTVLTCLAHGNSFFVEYESQYILQQPRSLKSFVIWTNIYISLAVAFTIGHYFYDVQSFINTTEQPKKYTSNNQTSIKSHFMRTYIYIVGCWLSTWRTYIYVLGCWHENILVAHKTVRGCIYKSLVAEVLIEWVHIECIKDIYIRPWLLEKICSARKGLRLED